MADLAVVPMGCDGLDEQVFATLEQVRAHGGELWWLYLSRCHVCGQDWMIAQDEHIFDDFFMRRLPEPQVREVLEEGRWPQEFLTYERVLRVGGKLSSHCTFFEDLAPSLVWTAEDLRRQRPDITVEEIAGLLGIDTARAARLLSVDKQQRAKSIGLEPT